MNQSFKQYLGDGIDFAYDGSRVILTGQTGRVYMRPEQIETLKTALTGLKRMLSKQPPRPNHLT